MRRLAAPALAAGLLGGPGLLAPAWAVLPDEVLADHAQEARARALSGELRCMVCQNESIDESNAPLARDLRVLVRQRIQAGDSDQAIKAFLTARYGDFVLLRPPVEGRTLLLWLGPFAVLAAGLAGVALAGRRRAAGPVPLTPDEQARLDRLMGRDGQEPGLTKM